MDIVKKLEWRYAVKKFNPERTLSKQKIEVLKQAFNLTATSYGLQPIKLIVVKNKSLQEKLTAHSYQQQQVAQASHLLILCREKEINATYIFNYFKRIQEVRGTSSEILDPFKAEMVRNFEMKTTEEIAQWAINQAYLILGNLLTVCAIEEIDACPMEGFDPFGYDKLLDLDSKGLASVLVLPIGYRAVDDLFSGFKKVRKDTEDCIVEIE